MSFTYHHNAGQNCKMNTAKRSCGKVDTTYSLNVHYSWGPTNCCNEWL